jgi:subtilase family serine protease
LVNAYRALFKLPTNPPQVVVDGGDPGVNGNNPGFDEDAIEAYLDVELAGSVAPVATVNLYIALFDTVNDPLMLAAQRAIEDNKADVLSISFGNCEQNLGTSHNQILNSLWQQAAAQGQTVFVSAGDSGSAGCDDPVTENLAGLGLAVSGFASTPWNIAVGGTDFFYQDYASGAPSAATLWNATNDANKGSLKAPLPEQVWNDSFGFDVMPSMFPLFAGSGGASSIYAKPSWQNAPGVPNDGHRDLPDVSLFAADGASLSAYAICANAGDCAADSNGRIPVSIVGGTSASSPAMAGIMALVNQKHGRQGQANFVLYPLARQFPTAFHDITLGGNNVPCLAGSPDCVIGTGTIETGRNTLSGYAAARGYDLASGLGSIDASMLVDNWGNITFLPSTTTLQLSSTTFAHGTPVTLNADVTHSSGSTSPSGNVSIQTNSPTPFDQTQSVLPIGSNGNASGSTDSLPGGSYEIWGSYAGDGNYSGSTSSPVSVTVAPEASTVSISAVALSPPVIPAANCVPSVGLGENAVASGSTVFPSTVLWMFANPTGKSGLSGATGSVAFTFDNLPPVSAVLNVDGIATWTTPATATTGTHSVVASYSGDSSYSPSQSSPFTYTVKQGSSNLAIGPGGICGNGTTTCTAVAGDAVPMEVLLQAIGCIAPTGTVTVTLGSQSQTVKMSSEGSYADQILTGIAEFTNLSPGNYPISATYSGDSNYRGATINSFTLSVVAPSGMRIPTSTTISESKSTLELFQSETSFTVAVTGGSGSGKTPTGTVIVYANGSGVASISLSPSGPNTASGIATSQLSTNFNFGANQITAVYTGDNTYQESVSSPIQLTVVETVARPDFTIAPSVSQFVLAKGGTANTSLNLASVFGFNGTVALSCTPSDTSITCSVSPSSVNVNASTTAQVTLMATSNGSNAAVTTQSRSSAAMLWLAGGSLMLGFLFLSSARKTAHGSRLPVTLGTAFLLLICIACGSGHNQVTKPQPPPPQPITPLNAHSIVVACTANGIIHNTQVTVVVQ